MTNPKDNPTEARCGECEHELFRTLITEAEERGYERGSKDGYSLGCPETLAAAQSKHEEEIRGLKETLLSNATLHVHDSGDTWTISKEDFNAAFDGKRKEQGK